MDLQIAVVGQQRLGVRVERFAEARLVREQVAELELQLRVTRGALVLRPQDERRRREGRGAKHEAKDPAHDRAQPSCVSISGSAPR